MGRFIRRGKAKAYFLPTVAGTGAPTNAEVAAGIDLSGRIADMSGWMLEGSRVDTPDLATDYVSNISGEKTTADSSFTFYSDDVAGTDPLKVAMPQDQAGFIYIPHSGNNPGKTADLFQIRVLNIGNEYDMGNSPARYVISYAITTKPRIDVVIPPAGP